LSSTAPCSSNRASKRLEREVLVVDAGPTGRRPVRRSGTVKRLYRRGVGDRGELLPGHRRREPAPPGIGRSEYADAIVRSRQFLVVVDEDPLAPLLLPPGRGPHRRRASRARGRSRSRRAVTSTNSPARLDPDEDVDPAVAAGLGPPAAGPSSSRSSARGNPGHPHGVGETSLPGWGSRSIPQLVGAVDVVATYRPRGWKVRRAHVGAPDRHRDLGPGRSPRPCARLGKVISTDSR